MRVDMNLTRIIVKEYKIDGFRKRINLIKIRNIICKVVLTKKIIRFVRTMIKIWIQIIKIIKLGNKFN